MDNKEQGKQRAKLIATIKQAFSDTVYPGDDNLTECICDECTEIRRDFRGKRWDDLTDVKSLRHYEAATALLLPEAYRYYLPAFMLAALKDPKTADVVVNNVIFSLTPPETEGYEAEEWLAQTGIPHMDYLLSRVRGFTTKQKKTIREYLQFDFQIDPVDWNPDEMEKRQRTMQFWQTFEG